MSNHHQVRQVLCPQKIRMIIINYCIILENRVKYLLKTYLRFTRGKANLEVLLGYQNCVLENLVLDIILFLERKSRSLQISFPQVNQMICLSLFTIII